MMPSQAEQDILIRMSREAHSKRHSAGIRKWGMYMASTVSTYRYGSLFSMSR